jgi:hypothetical protein
VPLPWLKLGLVADDADLSTTARRALWRFSAAASDALPPLRLELRRDGSPARPAGSTRAWREASLKYQFVRGVVTGERAEFATEDGSEVVLDHSAGLAVAMVRPSTPRGPYSTWPDFLASPLSEFWRIHGCYPLHAAAVELGERCVVLPAASGSGKTTLGLALAHAGGVWRADDKVLFRVGADGPEMVSLYRNVNLSPLTISRFDWLEFALTRPPLDDTNPKRACDMEEAAARVDLSPFRPTAMLFPMIAGEPRSSIGPLTPGEAVLRLARQSPASSLRERLAAQVGALAALARHLPAFELRAGGDVLDDPGSVAELVVRHVGEAGGP